MEYGIDPISAASPEMDDADFAALKQSIASIGQLVSIVSIDGTIIDGRKRYRACQELGKKPAVLELPLGADPATHAVALNLLRTHYTISQRSMYAAAIANAPHGYGLKPVPLINKFGDQYVTTAAAAKAVGVSVGVVTAAKRIRREGIPEVAAAVERGALTVHAATTIIESVPKPEQGAALARAVNAPKARDGRRIGTTKIAPELRRRQQRPKTAGVPEVMVQASMRHQTPDQTRGYTMQEVRGRVAEAMAKLLCA